jgi:two-component system NarL family response regulator
MSAMSTGERAIRVLCVDDHRLVLEGFTRIISLQSSFEVVGAATSGEEAVDLFRRCKPDVTLMDLQLPGMSGLDAIRVIRKEDPGARIVVVTMYQGDEDIFRALEAGATTYLLKDALPTELFEVIHSVYAGTPSLGPAVSARLASRSERPALTPREIDVLELVAEGLRNKEIASSLGLSETTIQVHVKNILSKLAVNDRTAAVNVALRRGIIHIS